MALMTADELRKLITSKIEEAGSQRTFAKQAGISPAYVNDYLQGYRAPGPSILAAVGVEKVDMYRKERQG